MKPTSTTEVAEVIADSGTLCSEAYALESEILPSDPTGAASGTALAEIIAALKDAEGPLACGLKRVAELVSWLAEDQTDLLEHGQLEERLTIDGRELLRAFLQGHLTLRAERERRLDGVIDAAGQERRAVEHGHGRSLASVFGSVEVKRLAYRQRGHENLHPGDGVLNLPPESHSHGLRRLTALEAPRGSFEDAAETIRRITGVAIGKRQVEELAARAVVDFEAFYAQRERDDPEEDDVLVLSCDGKGIVMRSEALRPATKKQAASSQNKLKTRLSRGEKRGRKRIAEVCAVYEVTPQVRTPADILPDTEAERQAARDGPKAKNKWVSASVIEDAASVIAKMFEEADRRDPEHRRRVVCLVDGNNGQIGAIKREAKTRKLKVTIVIDFVHVMEYLWSAAWCFFDEGDPAAERWVAEKGRAILEGKAGITAAAIRRKATRLGLDQAKRKNADICADYLLNKSAHLDYSTALAGGWPIATGIIEGACRHLVKDRMDITGARWGLDGAETVLKLRALKSNSDFDDYWHFHLAQERERIHQARYAGGVIPAPSHAA
jgi:hypothetical protein